MGLQGPPYAVLSPLVTDPLAPPGDPNQVYSSPTILYSRLVEYKIAGLGKTHTAYIGSFYISCVATPVKFTLPSDFDPPKLR